MINTVNTKQEQLRNGCFEIGNGPEKILIVGSCRSVPYVEYLNQANDGRLTIRYIDPFNWNWDCKENFVDFEAKINSLETDPRILEILSSTDIYIHEFYDSFGMFNSSKESPKNIYQFGLSPRLDICIPNFNDVHILGQPKEDGEGALEKFYGICRQTSFPEMEEYFRANWRMTRLFWTHNHVSRYFTLFIFRLLNDKFLHMDLSNAFWNGIAPLDLLGNTPGDVTKADRDNHQLQW